MGIIEEINRLPLRTKAIVISLGGFMPLWFVILYYFFPNILVIGWYEKLMFLFVPTVVWFLIEVGIISIFKSFAERHFNVTMPENEFWLLVGLEGAFYLGLMALIAYYSKMSFESFAWIAFLFRAGTLILFVVANAIIR